MTDLILLIGLCSSAGGTYLVVDAIRDSSRFASITGDERIALGGILSVAGAVAVSFSIIPFS